MNKKILIVKSQKGQTIVEAIVALVLIVIVLTAIAVVMIFGLFNSTFIKNQNEANKLAQDAMEFVRNIQKNNIEQFAAEEFRNSTVCLDEATQSLTSVGCNTQNVNINGTSYNRTVTFLEGGAPCEAAMGGNASRETLVTVNVRWASSKCQDATLCHSVKLEACLVNRYPASLP